MSVEYRKGDLFEFGADWLTVPVNMKGVMGAGLAKQFKLKFPGLEYRYRDCCKHKVLELGKPFTLFHDHGPGFVLFATKDDWRNPSELSWIDEGLAYLARTITVLEFRSIAIPPLGCGLGGLKWNEVRPLIEQHLGELEARILVYEPGRRPGR